MNEGTDPRTHPCRGRTLAAARRDPMARSCGHSGEREVRPVHSTASSPQKLTCALSFASAEETEASSLPKWIKRCAWQRVCVGCCVGRCSGRKKSHLGWPQRVALQLGPHQLADHVTARLLQRHLLLHWGQAVKVDDGVEEGVGRVPQRWCGGSLLVDRLLRSRGRRGAALAPSRLRLPHGCDAANAPPMGRAGHVHEPSHAGGAEAAGASLQRGEEGCPLGLQLLRQSGERAGRSEREIELRWKVGAGRGLLRRRAGLRVKVGAAGSQFEARRPAPAPGGDQPRIGPAKRG